MKKHHTTIVLLTLFFTGLLVLWWAQYAGVPSAQELEANQNFVLPELKSLTAAGIRKLEIDQRPNQGAEAARIVFERRADGWQMTEPMNVAADPSRLDTLAQNLKNLTKSTEAGTITDPPANFGLDRPVATIRAFGERPDAPVAVLHVGLTVRDRIYVRAMDRPGIEVADSRLLKGIDEAADGWRERSMFNLGTFQVAGLSIKRPGRELKAERVGGSWRLVSPIRVPADNNKIEEVLAELTSLRVPAGNAGFAANDVKDPAKYGLDDDHAVRVELVSIMNPSRPQTMRIGNPVPDQAGKVYALAGDQDDVMVVEGKRLQDLGGDPNGLRSTKVLAFEPARAGFVRIESLGRTFDMSRSADGWQIVNPARGGADQGAVTRLLTGLGELQTSEFFAPSKIANSGLDRPSATLKVWQIKPRQKLPAKAAAEPEGEPAVNLRLGRQDVARRTIYGQLAGDASILALPDAFLEALPQNELAFRPRSLLDLSVGAITRLTIVRDGRRIVLAPARTGEPNRWEMIEPVAAPAETEPVTKALVMLSKLHAEQLISDRPGDESRYGLDAPTLTVSWSTAGASPGTPAGELPATTLKIGARVPRSESWYAALSDRSLVFTLSEAVVLPFREEFHGRSIVSFPPKAVDRITLRWPDRSMSFDQHPTPRGGVSDWDPAPGTDGKGFDLSRISALANELSRLKTRKFLQYTGALPDTSGLAKPRLIVAYSLRGDPATHELRIGNPFEDRGEYLATTSGGNEGTVFVISGSGWSDLVDPGGAKKATQLPSDVFAPGPGKPPG